MSQRGPEAKLEAQVVQALKMTGATVYRLSQGVRGHFDRGAGKFVPDRGGVRQTRGIPDLEAWWPVRRQLAKFEVKTPEGLKLHDRMIEIPFHEAPASRRADWKRAHHQQAYADLCEQCGVHYGRGGMSELGELLVRMGIAK